MKDDIMRIYQKVHLVKIGGKTNNFGKDVNLSREKNKIVLTSMSEVSFFLVKACNSQCEKLGLFLSLEFSVKSILVN